MRFSTWASLLLAVFVLGCQSMQKANEPEIYLQPVDEKTDMMVIQSATGDQVIDLMERFLKPRLYKELSVQAPSECRYVYSKVGTQLGATCSELVKPTCFELVESIRKSIWSKQEVEMNTQICAGRSRAQDAIVLEIVYGDQTKWSGNNKSVNAQKEFAELREVLAEQIGPKNVLFVRKTTVPRAQ